MVFLSVEMFEFKVNVNRRVVGIVIEVKFDKGRGLVVSLLV